MFRDMSVKLNEKHNVEDVFTEEKVIDILKNIQNEPITCSKVSSIPKLTRYLYFYVKQWK